MQYPTLEEVESADRIQLARWYRFLPSPGISAIGKHPDTFGPTLEKESIILEHIEIRFKEMGGFTPEISKEIGWEE